MPSNVVIYVHMCTYVRTYVGICVNYNGYPSPGQCEKTNRNETHRHTKSLMYGKIARKVTYSLYGMRNGETKQGLKTGTVNTSPCW